MAVNLRLLVYRYGMKKSGTAEKWEVMFQRYQESSLAQEKDKLLYGLASVENIHLLSRYPQNKPCEGGPDLTKQSITIKKLKFSVQSKELEFFSH